jgi:hypothetical protein
VRAIDGTVGNVLVWPPIRTAIVFRCIILHSCVSTIRSGLYSYLSHISHREMPPAAGPRLLSLSPDERIVPCVPYEVICTGAGGQELRLLCQRSVDGTQSSCKVKR